MRTFGTVRLLVLVMVSFVLVADVMVAGDCAHLEVEPFGDGAAADDGIYQEQTIDQIWSDQCQRADYVSASADCETDEGPDSELGADVDQTLSHLLHAGILEVVGQILGLRPVLAGGKLLADEVHVNHGERLEHQLDFVALAEGRKLQLAVQANVVEGHYDGSTLMLLLLLVLLVGRRQVVVMSLLDDQHVAILSDDLERLAAQRLVGMHLRWMLMRNAKRGASLEAFAMLAKSLFDQEQLLSSVSC